MTATETGAYTTCLAEGGGFYISNATDFRDSLITGNKAASPFGFADGGGGRSVGSLVRNCTVVMNQASAPSNPSQGGGMQWGGTDQPVNDIVVFNSSSSLPNNSYVNPLNPPTFIDCFFADPSFVNPMIGDFHLQDTSPCINAGTNQSWMIGAQDLDGNNRIGGGTVDIGAYEHSSLTPTLANARQSGNQIILSWPTNATGFTLQSSTALSGPVVWSSGFSPVTVGSNFVVSNTIATGTRFYRLKK